MEEVVGSIPTGSTNIPSRNMGKLVRAVVNYRQRTPYSIEPRRVT
jgi:hypothetical protein